jgi:hypothetical protein
MAGQLTISTLNNDTGVLATQNGMTGIAKAWIRFDGRANPVTIQGSFNISSVTYVEAGLYTLNFTTAMPNTSYAAASMGEWKSGFSSAGVVCMNQDYPPSTTALTVSYNGVGGSANLYYYVNVIVLSS